MLNREQRQMFRIWNLSLSTPLVRHAVADWLDEGRPISFDQLVQELLLR